MPTNIKANRLINEKSPYLLQHAYNPVDWFPWSDEAFQKAKSEDKPVFLSIGYSTCHWCHVMERESFEDEEVAEILNEHFISIKVDREERPDIDSIYMSVCQALTGHGGWPLTIIMTPDRKPFFAGTYFPKHDRYGIAGLISILKGIRTAWANKKEELLYAGERITNAIQQDDVIDDKPLSSDEIIHDAYQQYCRSFDSEYGGFGTAPKFPSPHNLFYLLRYWYATGEDKALDMVEKTLDSMWRGGIYDHIGFGFCRYSTDRKWLVPHFEKMLYDNALLSVAYVETFQATGNKEYARVAKEIFSYVKREMTSPEGGFYSAEDADSEGREGLFYIWKPSDIIRILGEKDGKLFCKVYDITEDGNFEGFSIPNRIYSVPVDQDFVNKCREKLFLERQKRVHPFKDDKILTAWNALMAASFAVGARILSDSSLTNMARRAVSFIESRLIRNDGRLLARYRDREAAIPAFLDDYAYLQWAYLELYQTTYESEYLNKAIKIFNEIENLFYDREKGGFFLYGNDSEKLIMRPKDAYDGAMPSGNSVIAMNPLRLYRITGNIRLMDVFQSQLNYFGGKISLAPLGYAYMLTAYLTSLQPSHEVVLVSDGSEEQIKPFLDVLHNRFRPFTTSVRYGRKYRDMDKIIPYISGYKGLDGKPQAYVCQNFTCHQPVSDADSFSQLLS